MKNCLYSRQYTTLFHGSEELSSASDKGKLFAVFFCRYSYVSDSRTSLFDITSKSTLNLHNISATPKMVKKVITNLASLQTSGSDCVSVVVLKKCQREFSYLLADRFIMCMKKPCFPDFWKVLPLVLLLRNFGERCGK